MSYPSEPVPSTVDPRLQVARQRGPNLSSCRQWSARGSRIGCAPFGRQLALSSKSFDPEQVDYLKSLERHARMTKIPTKRLRIYLFIYVSFGVWIVSLFLSPSISVPSFDTKTMTHASMLRPQSLQVLKQGLCHAAVSR